MIIAIGGKNGIGKDTLGKYLKSKISNAKIIKFSSKPNQYFKELCEIDFLSLPRTSKELIRPKFIEFCEGHKKIFGEEVWVNLLIKYILDDIYKTNTVYIITDLRFKVEYEALKKLNTYFIYLSDKDEISLSSNINICNKMNGIDNFKKEIDEILISSLKKLKNNNIIWKN